MDSLALKIKDLYQQFTALNLADKSAVLGFVLALIVAIASPYVYNRAKPSNSPVTIIQQGDGYTIEQHQQILEKRLSELRADLERAHKAELRAEQQGLQRRYDQVQAQLANLQTSYAERRTEIERLRASLAELSAAANLPQQRLQAALKQLVRGELGAAEELLAEVEQLSAAAIATAARAAYERGQIAYLEVRWQEALAHFQRADRLYDSKNELALAWHASLHYELGDYRTAEPLMQQSV